MGGLISVDLRCVYNTVSLVLFTDPSSDHTLQLNNLINLLYQQPSTNFPNHSNTMPSTTSTITYASAPPAYSPTAAPAPKYTPKKDFGKAFADLQGRYGCESLHYDLSFLVLIFLWQLTAHRFSRARMKSPSPSPRLGPLPTLLPNPRRTS